MLLVEYDEGRNTFGGCDLSSTVDLTSFCLLQRRESGFNCNWWFWLPEETVASAKSDEKIRYDQWDKDGFLTVTPGARIRHDFVKRDIVDICLEHDCGMIGYDPWNSEWLQSQVEEEGIESIKVRQGYASLSEPCKHLEASVAEGSFRHGNNPIARFCAENVEVQQDVNGNLRPVKPAHGSAKRIDGIVAAVTAIAVAIVNDDEDTTSIYEEPGGLLL